MEKELLPESSDKPETPEFASWRSYQKFEQRVRRHRRHIWTKEIESFLDTVRQTANKRRTRITEGSILWRAQLDIEYRALKDENGMEYGEEPVGFPPARMKPDTAHSKEGRANSAGIPVLYLASTKQTAISEVRPWVGSEVSVAQFRITRELATIDLTEGHGKLSWTNLNLRHLIGKEEPDAEAREQAVWIDIDNAFSRPVTPSDENVSYLPTRILGELFQEAGFDALVYRSQFDQGDRVGYNIAVFDLEDAEIINCAPYEVEGIEVKFKEIGNRWSSEAGARSSNG